jgi:hypothetical protein
MIIESPARQREFGAPIGSSELAEGLMLVRASTLKMIRLQLAMDRNDRRVVLEAVDDLVALDRRLQEYIADAPAAPQQLLFRNALDAERAMLAQETLTLAAEVIRRPREAAVETPMPDEDDWLGPRDLPEPAEERRRSRWWLVTVPVALVSAAAAGAYFMGLGEAQAWIQSAARMLQ